MSKAERNELAAAGLTPGSRPCAVEFVSARTVVSRRDSCARYDNCLIYAIRLRWRSFSCDGCEVREQMTSEQAKMDAERVRPLVAEVFRRVGEASKTVD